MAANKSSARSAVKGAVLSSTKKAPPTKSAPTKATKKSSPTSAKQTAPTTTAAAKKTAAKKTAAKKTAAKKTTAKKTTAKKTTATRQSTAKKTPTKTTTAKKTTAIKTASTAAARKGTSPKESGVRSAAKKSAAEPVPSKKTSTASPKKEAVKKSTTPSSAGDALAVRDREKPWSVAEIKEVRSTLEQDRERLIAEIAATEEEISHLLREGGEGAGNDQADVGSNTFERDHEMSMAKNSRESLGLVEGALARIDRGSYGVCESCGGAIGKMRLQAFPRATLCLECKQRQERR